MNCLICGKKLLNHVGKNPSFSELGVYESTKCEFAMTYPLPTSEQLLEFYQPGFYIKDPNLAELDRRLQVSEQRASAQLKFMKKALYKPTSIKAMDSPAR